MLADGSIVLPLAFIGRLFIPLVFLHVGQNTRLFAGLGEPAQGFLKGLSRSDNYTGHGMLNSPLFGLCK